MKSGNSKHPLSVEGQGFRTKVAWGVEIYLSCGVLGLLGNGSTRTTVCEAGSLEIARRHYVLPRPQTVVLLLLVAMVS